MTKSAAPRMNVDLLLKIKAHILEEPRRLKMRQWLRRGIPNESTYEADGGALVTFPDCGYAACIGGWTILLSGEKASEQEMLGDRAARLLHIEPLSNDGETTASHRLFLVEDWPRKFRTAYTRATRPLTRARIAAARIDHFIKTKGAE